jgi:transcriptional regulator with XRE-family HTH domain
MTLEDLAARSGTSAPTLSNYERGQKEPRFSTLERIVAATGHELRLEALPSRVRRPLTRKDRRSLALHRLVAARLAADPDAVIGRASKNLDHLREVHDDGSADRYLDAWEALLRGPLDDLLDALTSERQSARDLRNVSPFAGVLGDDERRRILGSVR